MLKTIRTIKHMRLDELLKLCWDNHITSGIYNSNKKSFVRVLDSSNVIVVGCVSATDIFEVTYEEEITEDTKFHILVGIYFLEEIESYDAITFYNRSIDDVKDCDAECIYALIDNKLQLIWESEK